MNTKSQKNISAILQVLHESDQPLGGTRIAQLVQRFGINLSQRTVRHYLLQTDKAGLTAIEGKSGRLITELGREELSKSFVFEKVGLIASKIDELSYRIKFSLNTNKGTLVLNVSTFDARYCTEVVKEMLPVFDTGLGMGHFVVFGEEGKALGTFSIPANKIAIGTICSVTINGIFLNAGIPVTSRFGGLLEIRDYNPVRFTEIINYDGTTVDPLAIFIKSGMTSVSQAARTGNGIIGVGFREIPAIAIPEAKKIRSKLQKIGLNGILMIGSPGQPLLDIPVSERKAGMIVVGGLNPMAAAEEQGIQTQNIAMGTVFAFNKLTHYSHLKKIQERSQAAQKEKHRHDVWRMKYSEEK